MIDKSKAFAILLAILLFDCPAKAQSNLHWTLKQCIDSAIVNNLNLRQSVNTIELDRIGVKQSKNNLLPSINGNVAENLSIGRMVNPVTEVYETGTVWTTNAGISLSQNLFNGLQYLNAIKQNELTYQSSKYDWEDAKFNLTISIINDFLQVLYTSEAIKIARNQVLADSVQLQTTSDLEYVGKKTESDLLQIKSQLSTDKYALVNATSQWKIAKVNLQQLMNLKVDEFFDIDYTASVEPQQKTLEDIGSIYSQSLAFQPIVKSYALKTQSAFYAVRVAKGAYYPQLLLKGNIGTDYSSIAKQTNTITSTSLQNIGYLQSNPSDIVVGNVPQQATTVSNYPFGNQIGDNLNGTLSIALAIPILNYLQVRNNVRKQRVNLNNARLNEELTKVNLRKTIEQVYTNTENSTVQFQSANEEVEASKAAYDVSVEKYKQGKMIASDLILQQNSYIKALSDYLQTKYGLLFNSKILDYYKGVPITY
jgi:outer membrane protein